MSVDKAIRDMIRDEVSAAIGPLAAAVQQIQNQGGVLAQLSAVLGGQKRGPGRPPNPFKVKVASGGAPRRRSRGKNGTNDRGCALIGCKRPSRSKGYCAAHYQKLRMLTKTNRRPSSWVDYAPPNSVDDVKLPRGRAAAKALAEANQGGSST
jgi:hypothetical protein